MRPSLEEHRRRLAERDARQQAAQKAQKRPVSHELPPSHELMASRWRGYHEGPERGPFRNHDGLAMTLPFPDLHEDPELRFTKTAPPVCAGAIGTKAQNKKWGLRPGQPRYRCNNPELCLFCAERQRWAGAWDAMRRHYHNGKTIKFSITLPQWRTDPLKVHEARKALIKVLRKHGYTQHTIWVQVYGDNPFEGPKGHLDGLASGPDPEPWKAGNRRPPDPIVKALDGAWGHGQEPRWQLGHVTDHDDDAEKRAAEIIGGAKYAARQTLDVTALRAGMFAPGGELRFRFTRARWAMKREFAKIESIDNPRTVDGCFTREDVEDAIRTHRAWRRGVKRLRHSDAPKLSSSQMKSLLKTCKWGQKWRIPAYDEARKQVQ